MTEHKVHVYSWKPFSASSPISLSTCEGKLTVEAIEEACKRGKCKNGHPVIVTGPVKTGSRG